MDKKKALETVTRLLKKVESSDSLEEKRTASYAAVQLVIKHELVILDKMPSTAAGLAALADLQTQMDSIYADVIKRRQDVLENAAKQRTARRKKPVTAPPEFPEPAIRVVNSPANCYWCGQPLPAKESCYEYPDGKKIHFACRPYFEKK